MNTRCESFTTERNSLSQDENEEIINLMDENENFVIGDPKDEVNTEECSAGNSVSSLVPELQKLQLAQQTNPRDSEQLAGYVRAVIPACNTVVVGLAPGGRILDVGTAIFALTDEEAPREIGFVADIFGSVHEPMYSLQLTEGAVGGSLEVDAEVFYLRGHPSTGYISVKRDANNRYTILRNTDIF